MIFLRFLGFLRLEIVGILSFFFRVICPSGLCTREILTVLHCHKILNHHLLSFRRPSTRPSCPLGQASWKRTRKRVRAHVILGNSAVGHRRRTLLNGRTLYQ